MNEAPTLGQPRCVIAVKDLSRSSAWWRDEPRGMREFGIRTGDGHRMMFGQPSST